MSIRITLGALRLGKELRALREHAGIGIDVAADAIDKSPPSVSRFETGKTVIRRLELLALLDLYGVIEAERRAYFVTLASEARKTKSWWSVYTDVLPAKFDTWLSLEPDASTIRDYCSLNIPGILQTEAFARAQMKAGPVADEVDRLVKLRLKRQELFDTETAPDYTVVIDEAALHRAVGGPEVLRGQLQYLGAMAEHPHVTIQLIPFEAGSYRMYGMPFIMMSFEDVQMPSIVYLEAVHGNIYLERDQDIRQYSETFDVQQDAALPPDESLQLIERLAARLR